MRSGNVKVVRKGGRGDGEVRAKKARKGVEVSDLNDALGGRDHGKGYRVYLSLGGGEWFEMLKGMSCVDEAKCEYDCTRVRGGDGGISGGGGGGVGYSMSSPMSRDEWCVFLKDIRNTSDLFFDCKKNIFKMFGFSEADVKSGLLLWMSVRDTYSTFCRVSQDIFLRLLWKKYPQYRGEMYGIFFLVMFYSGVFQGYFAKSRCSMCSCAGRLCEDTGPNAYRSGIMFSFGFYKCHSDCVDELGLVNALFHLFKCNFSNAYKELDTLATDHYKNPYLLDDVLMTADFHLCRVLDNVGLGDYMSCRREYPKRVEESVGAVQTVLDNLYSAHHNSDVEELLGGGEEGTIE